MENPNFTPSPDPITEREKYRIWRDSAENPQNTVYFTDEEMIAAVIAIEMERENRRGIR